MPNRQSPRLAAHTLFEDSSWAILDTLYAGWGPNATTDRVAQREKRASAPDAIWGQFNNYRSCGLVGSAIVHVALLGLILTAATFGH